MNQRPPLAPWMTRARIDNTDDHEKNHALLMTDAAEYELAPAYDVLPAGQAWAFSKLRVGQDGADSTLENALSMCDQFALELADARLELQKVATVVEVWARSLPCSPRQRGRYRPARRAD